MMKNIVQTLLNSGRLDAMTSSLGSLFLCLTIFSVKSLFLMSKLNFPGMKQLHSISCVLSLVTRVEISTPCTPGIPGTPYIPGTLGTAQAAHTASVPGTARTSGTARIPASLSTLALWAQHWD